MRALNLTAAQPYTRPEDELASRWLDRAITRAAHPIKGLARAIGRSEKTLHEMRRGLYRVGLADVLRMPLELRREIARDFISACGFELYEPIDSAEDLVNAVGELIAASADATRPLLQHRDAELLSRDEAVKIKPLVRAIAERARALERLCDSARPVEVEIRNRHDRPLASERTRNRRAQTASGAGDHGNASLERAHRAETRLGCRNAVAADACLPPANSVLWRGTSSS